MLIKISKSP